MRTPAIDINKLAPEERLALIGDLWDSLRARPETLHVTPAQQKVLDRRLDALENDDDAVISWDDAKRRLRG
ncbi:MAG: addiction module protein [Coriobacteriia bacterium]|jgi:putative addiction module component (TIGR02574 family)